MSVRISPFVFIGLMISILLAADISSQTEQLKTSGHIQTSEKSIWQRQGDISLIRTPYGTLQFDFNGDFPPVKIRLWDADNSILRSWEFYRTINLRVSQSHRHLGFFDGKKLIVIDLKTGSVEKYPPALKFGLDHCGVPVYFDELLQLEPEKEFLLRQPSNIDTHEPIRAPLHYYETSFPSLVRNGYAQVQEWDHAYLHPGVDMFEEPYTEVYSVADGIVRAILTTGDERYWRTAIERLDLPGEGYLYAHLNQDSFVYQIGDTVTAGDIVGTIFPAWGFSPHVHFARISPDEPGLWNGNWWTLDNPLVDITNMTDDIPPVFENALESNLFAFRTPAGEYLDQMSLYGEIDIIAKVVDYAYSVEFYSRIVPYDMKFRFYSAANPDSIVYERYSFALDMPLDTYFDQYYYTLVLETIYSRDEVCFSTNNNSNRDFFFILTNSNGDSVISEEDSSEVFDTTELPNGSYLLEVVLRDCALNEATALAPIYIDNIVPVMDDPDEALFIKELIFGGPYPNPFNAETVIPLALPERSRIRVQLFDLLGRKIGEIYNGVENAGHRRVHFDASNLASGMYLYRITAEGLESGGRFESVGKMLLLK